MRVIVVVEVEVQVVVTKTVPACAEAARRWVRGSGWRIVVDVVLDARERFGGALCLMWIVGESFERARWSSGFAQSG